MKRYFIIFYILIFIGRGLGQNIQTGKLNDLIKEAEKTHTEALIVYQENKLVTEKYFGIGKPETKIETMSCTKSIVGLAVACMLDDHLIDSLDIPVSYYYSEWKQGQKQGITLRHLVNMTSGIQNNPDASAEIYPSHDFVQLALCAEISDPPGSKWSYNNKALNLLAGIIKKITGKRMDQYIQERLFKPLDIVDFSWSLDSAGNPHVMSGCQVKPRDFIKIGLLLANKGMYNNQRVISENNMALVVNPCSQYKGYGMLWWIDYEKTTSIIDDDLIANFRKLGVSKEFVDKAEKIKGIYLSDNEYYKAVEHIFGEQAWNIVSDNLAPKGLTLRRKEFSGTITYRADGYLGNYIIVDPINKITAIRMISHTSFNEDEDNFYNFREMVLQLTKY